jgi:hypothetical protein
MLSHFKWVGAAAAVLAVATGAIYWIQMRSLVVFRPDDTIKSGIVSKALPKDELPLEGETDPSAAPTNSPTAGLPE